RELDLQATGVAPRGGREVGWPGVLGGSESARRPPVLSAPRALSLVTEGRRAGRTRSGRIPLLSFTARPHGRNQRGARQLLEKIYATCGEVGERDSICLSHARRYAVASIFRRCDTRRPTDARPPPFARRSPLRARPAGAVPV